MLDRILGLLILLLVALLTWQLMQESSSELAENAQVQEKTAKQLTAPSQKMPDFASIQDVKQKKQAFAEFLLPAIEAANAKVLQQREFLLALTANKFSELSKSQQIEFESLAEKYQQPREKEQSFKNWRQALLKKVDIIPPSLALAQAANESAWGTSRFAKQGFNFYGQWCFSKGCGLVPTQRGSGETHEVRVFNSPQHSVEAYINNLNAFHVYADLREIRAKQRSKNQQITGKKLAEGLIDYSQRREAYIKELQQMIRVNGWAALD